MPNERVEERKNLVEFDAVIELEELRINEYHPLPDGQGKPTEVHLALTPKGKRGVVMIMRMKSRRVVDELIEALEHHRDSVWPVD